MYSSRNYSPVVCMAALPQYQCHFLFLTFDHFSPAFPSLPTSFLLLFLSLSLSFSLFQAALLAAGTIIQNWGKKPISTFAAKGARCVSSSVCGVRWSARRGRYCVFLHNSLVSSLTLVFHTPCRIRRIRLDVHRDVPERAVLQYGTPSRHIRQIQALLLARPRAECGRDGTAVPHGRGRGGHVVGQLLWCAALCDKWNLRVDVRR